MLFRKATEKDLPEMMAIAMAGVAFLKAQKVDQWQTGGYPNREVFLSDIAKGQSYILEDQGRVLAVSAIISGLDLSYASIDGAWINTTQPYVTIHRCAVHPHVRGQGVMPLLFQNAADLGKALGAASLRVDTHPDNQPMQRAIAKAGFTKCGIITLAEGAEKGRIRYSYELMFS